LLALTIIVLGVGCTHRTGDQSGGSSASSTGPTTTLDPRNEILAAYRGFWADVIEAGKTADADSPRLDDHATDRALDNLRSDYRRLRAKGEVVRGTVRLHPRVASVRGSHRHRQRLQRRHRLPPLRRQDRRPQGAAQDRHRRSRGDAAARRRELAGVQDRGEAIMQTLTAALLSLALLLTFASPAWAGNRPGFDVAEGATGVRATASSPGRPAEAASNDNGEDDGAPSDGGRIVSCSYNTVASPSGGLTFAATCSNPSAANISFDPMGNVRFIVPVPGDPAPAPGAAPPAGQQVTPAMLARQASRFLPLPLPIIHTNPPADRDQVVNLPTWLWVDAARWGRRTATAAVPGLSVTVVATPSTVTWRPGDGTVHVCHGPGTAYDPARAPGAQQTACSYTYHRSSLGAPAGRYQMTATITWDVSWTTTGAIGASGTLPPMARSAATELRVIEAETLN